MAVFDVCWPSEVDRGVGDWLWLGRRSSYRPAAWNEGSQEVLLRRSGGGFSQLCQGWSVRALKVGRKLAVFDVLWPSEVVFSVF